MIDEEYEGEQLELALEFPKPRVKATRRWVRSPLSLVRDFHEKFECAINDRSDDAITSRLTLIDEELGELVDELMDFDDMDGDGLGSVRSDIDYKAVAKELADLVYVVYGTALALGIDLDKAVRLVHDSNMSKLWPDGKPRYRESDGKVLKPPTYVVPDMEEAVFNVSL